MYPPASTIKLPLALALLDRVDKGELALTDMIEVLPAEMNPAGPIGDEFIHPGVALSIANLLEPMITRSCNTATDVLFRVLGGPVSGAALPRAHRHRRVRGEADDARGALRAARDPGAARAHIDRRGAAQPAARVLDARNRTDADFHHDQRDHATPRAMLSLLARLWNGELFARSRASCCWRSCRARRPGRPACAPACRPA
jgi:beta-lactamase class A